MDLNDPDLTISGHGHVDGYIPNMSSGQGELHSITELSIIANFLSEFHSFDGSIKAVCDNQAVINKCHSLSTHNLQRHHDPNFDVYIMQATTGKHPGCHWIGSKGMLTNFHGKHQPILFYKSSPGMKFTTYGVIDLLNRHGIKAVPVFLTLMSLPYPYTHKIIGDFNTEIYATLSYKSTLTYLQSRHNLSLTKLEHVQCHALQKHILSLPIHQQAGTVKCIRGLIPTNALLCHQGQFDTPMCLHCTSHLETIAHILTCPDTVSSNERLVHLRTFLANLININTPVHIIITFKYKLSLTLNVPYERMYNSATGISSDHWLALITAI
jgi:hypothetical protein